MEATIHKGERWSAAKAYLRPPAQATGNCELVRGLARKVVFEAGRAVGVEVERGGKIEVIRATVEVVLAASSLNTPKLLMLSGVGPAAHLKERGIEVIADRAGVGANLQDHLEIYFQWAAKKPITLYKYWNLFGKAMIGAQWLFTKTGLGTSNQFEACAFIRSDKAWTILISSITSCRSRCAMTGRRRRRDTGSRRMSGRCARNREALSRCAQAIRRIIRSSSSTICRIQMIGRSSANVSA